MDYKLLNTSTELERIPVANLPTMTPEVNIAKVS